MRRAEVPTRICVERAEPIVSSVSWSEHWRPCRGYFEADRRLVHRIVQLKKAWLALLGQPERKSRQRVFCWRYFALLHQALNIARTEPCRGDPIPILHRIIAFESFPIEARGQEAAAAGAFANRNPVYLLGRLQTQPPLPTPRHLPLILPLGQSALFYCYRQLRLAEPSGSSMLVFPAAGLRERQASFGPIDRLTRLVSAEPDPRARRRGRLLARRVLLPLVRAQNDEHAAPAASYFSILDIGAGTGHLAAAAWHEVVRRSRPRSFPDAAMHFVDASGPCGGRSFGMSGPLDHVACAEWTTADYRDIADDDTWLQAHGPFDWVFLCRVLCNASNISVEPANELDDDGDSSWSDCNPAHCPAPSRQPQGTESLEVRPVSFILRSGTTMPQLSLSDYFAAIKIVQAGDLGVVAGSRRYLPVRRFNPAALITARGQSVLAQLLKASSAIVVEDPDVQPEYLVGHMQQFGLDRFAAVHFVRDGFHTKVHHYAIARPELAERLPGKRLC
jgi:hypothetical protein